MASQRDYYEVLGVDRNASDQDLKRAYRQLALKYHPDRNPDNKKAAEERFKEASEAYAVLADPEKRARYDRFGHAGVGAAAGARVDPEIFRDFSDIFGDLGGMFGFPFGDMFGGGRRRRGGPERGADLRYDLEISFEEAARGAETKIQIPRLEPCDTCRGSGAKPGTGRTACPACHGHGQLRYQQGFFTVQRTCSRCEGTGQILKSPCETCGGAGRRRKERKLTIKIPAGVDSGSRLRVVGEGEGGVAGGPPGDLYVIMHVQDHPFFRREGHDLYCTVPISFAQAGLGGEISVPTLNGIEKTRVAEGTQSGTVLRLRGKGLPNVSGRGHGDLFVTLAVVTPTKLTKEQRRLLEELARVLPAPDLAQSDRSEDNPNFFDRVKDIFG